MTSPFTKLFAILLAAFGVTSLIAAVPVAVWEGFTGDKPLARGDYSWTKSANTTISDGVVTIGSDGGLGLEVPAGSTMRTARKVTVIMDVANIPQADVALFDLVVNDAHVWLGSNDTTLRQRWNTTTGDYGTLNDFSRSVAHRIAVTFEGTRGVGTTTYVDGVQKMNNTGLQSSANELTKLFVGNYNGGTSNIAEGMTITKLALFDSKLSADDVAGYKFPSELTAFTADNVSGSVAWSALPFDNEWQNGENNAAVINLSGDATITVPTDLVAKTVTFVGNHTVTLVYDTLPAGVGDFAGANLTHTVTAAEIAAGFTVPASIEYVITSIIEPTDEMGVVAVDPDATLVIRGVTTTPKFGTTTMKGNLVIEKGATMVANITDLVEFHSATEVHVYGTLDLALTRQTLYPFNKIYLYGGGEITGSADGDINNGCHLNTINAGSGVVCKVGPEGEDTATISAVIGPQAAVSTIDVEEGLTVTLSATVASTTASRKQGLEKTGLGALTIAGDISTLASFKCVAGETTIALGAAVPTILAGDGTVTLQPHAFNGTEDELWSKAANWEQGLKPAMGAAVALNAPVTLDETISLNKLTANSHAVTIAEEATLTVPSTTDLTVKGAGTLAFSDSVLPNMTTLTALKAALTDAENWSGTLVLKNVQGILSFDPNTLGNTTSTLRLSGVLAYFKNASFTINPTLDLVNSTGDFAYGLKVNNGWGGNVITTKKLTGNGIFLVTKPSGAPRIRFIMQNIADFTGTLDLDTAGNASAIVLGVDSATTSNDDDGCVVVKGDVTLPTGATLATHVPGKSVKIDAGTTLTNNGTIATAVGGLGKVAYVNRTLADLNTAMYTNALWQGTLLLKDFGGMGSNNHVSGALGNTLPYWGNENSKVEFTNVKAYLPNANVTCPYTLVLTDDGENVAWYNDNGYSSNWAKFGALAGTGTLKDTYASCVQQIAFGTAADFTGTLTLAGKRITIGTTPLAAGNGVVNVESGAAIATADKTWTVPGGVTIESGATLVYKGGALTLAQGNALTASGTINVALGEGVPLDKATPLCEVLAWSAKPENLAVEAEGLPKGWSAKAKADGLWLIYSSPLIFTIE